MIQLVYRSRALPAFTDAQIEDILFVSRRNNARDAITGVLLFQSGHILQVLEGEEIQVLRLFQAIRVDLRHRDVTPVYTRFLPTREFADWSMGFRLLDTAFWTIPAGASDIRRLVTAIALQPESIARSALLAFNRATV